MFMWYGTMQMAGIYQLPIKHNLVNSHQAFEYANEPLVSIKS